STDTTRTQVIFATDRAATGENQAVAWHPRTRINHGSNHTKSPFDLEFQERNNYEEVCPKAEEDEEIKRIYLQPLEEGRVSLYISTRNVHILLTSYAYVSFTFLPSLSRPSAFLGFGKSNYLLMMNAVFCCKSSCVKIILLFMSLSNLSLTEITKKYLLRHFKVVCSRIRFWDTNLTSNKYSQNLKLARNNTVLLDSLERRKRCYRRGSRNLSHHI
ncbi:unnamed protein product, partial [Brassica oleracea var. botrytis]